MINWMLDRHVKDKELLIGRPYGCVGAPLVLYNSVFYDFKRYYNDENLLMDDDHYQWTLGIIKLMAEFYVNADQREKTFHGEIRKLFGQDIRKIQLEDGTSNDGILALDFYTFTVLCVLMEVKNEIGTGGCDPTTQAAASYAKFYIQEKNNKLLKGCNMPCFIIGLAGPWICVLGAVYAEKPIVEPLTAFEPLITTYDQTHIFKIARLFRALRLVVDKLKDYYNSLPNTVIRDGDPQRFYPFLREAKNVVRILNDNLMTTFLRLSFPKKFSIKKSFCVNEFSKYNEYAHKLCFGIKRSPKLLHVEMMTCGFYCVVMDYIDGRRLSECYGLKNSEYEKIIEDIEEAITLLHSKEIVFADLRDANILVIEENDEYRGMLVDFDWAGVNNVDSYPPLMNPDINWPTGANGNMPLKKEHDIYWLNFLKGTYLHGYVDDDD